MYTENYRPAQLYEGKEWIIKYYVKNPQTEKLQRIRIKINRIKNIKHRRKYAFELIKDINNKLNNGWNPLIEHEASKSFFLLFDAFDTFLKLKEKELRKDSIRTYKSNIQLLKKFCISEFKDKKLYAVSFKRQNALNYLNYLYTERKISNRAYNNQRLFGVTLWNWLIENNYCKINVFQGLSSKKTGQKTRQIIDAKTRAKIKLYLEEKGKYEFLSIVYLCYFGLIRPKEILYLKPSNIDLENRVIIISPEFSKNGKLRKTTIPDTLYNSLLKLNIDKIEPQNYIFSTYYKPGKVLVNPRRIAKTWNNIRLNLNLSKNIQFYSLKDSGIIQMLRDGISPETVRDQAGHSSLEMTNKYIQYAVNEANPQILQKSGDF